MKQIALKYGLSEIRTAKYIDHTTIQFPIAVLAIKAIWDCVCE